jgi:hypothetical protein
MNRAVQVSNSSFISNWIPPYSLISSPFPSILSLLSFSLLTLSSLFNSPFSPLPYFLSSPFLSSPSVTLLSLPPYTFLPSLLSSYHLCPYIHSLVYYSHAICGQQDAQSAPHREKKSTQSGRYRAEDNRRHGSGHTFFLKEGMRKGGWRGELRWGSGGRRG